MTERTLTEQSVSFDLVAELRRQASEWAEAKFGWSVAPYFIKAADEIERLNREVDKLKAHLTSAYEYMDHGSMADLEAREDARLFGNGFVMYRANGHKERLDPQTVFIGSERVR